MTIQTQMNLGRVRPVYKGAYNALFNYGTLDMVLYEKEIWMMVARSYTPGDLPVDSGNGMSASGAWAKIGYQGEQGVQGLTGPIGPYYTPSVAVDGTISWMNNGGLVNPSSVKLDLYWHQISGTCTQVSTMQFTVAGTESAIVEGRGVRFNDSLLAHISAVAVENDVTTVTVDSAVVPATILKVEVGVISIDMLPTITGFLPLAGGAMCGTIIATNHPALARQNDNSYLTLCGGATNAVANGAILYLYGTESSQSGAFRFITGGTAHNLYGRPDGTLTWDGYNVVTDKVETITPTLNTTLFKQYSNISANIPVLFKCGKVCCLCGSVTTLSEIDSSAISTICTLPSNVRPSRTFFAICQGSGINRWQLSISTDGQCQISRYGASGIINIPVGAWLPFSATYVCE